MKKFTILVSISIILFFTSCTECDKEFNVSDETIAIEHLLENYIIANETQDFDLIEYIWSSEGDIILYGTDSHERLMGWSNIGKAVKSQFRQIEDTYISESDQYIKMNCTGNVAWFAETLDYNFMYKGEANKYEGLRFTGVVEKIDGEWKLVQAHLSVPARVGVGK